MPPTHDGGWRHCRSRRRELLTSRGPAGCSSCARVAPASTATPMASWRSGASGHSASRILHAVAMRPRGDGARRCRGRLAARGRGARGDAGGSCSSRTASRGVLVRPLAGDGGLRAIAPAPSSSPPAASFKRGAITTTRSSDGRWPGDGGTGPARLADLEFMQFPNRARRAARPAALLTEALRGEGATLLDGSGRRFMVAEHPMAELAPRDGRGGADLRRRQRGERVPRRA